MEERIDTAFASAPALGPAGLTDGFAARIFQDAPVAIALLRGADPIFEIANPHYERMVSRRGLVGRRAKEALHELGDEVWQMLEGVRTTGVPVTFDAFEAPLDRDGDGRLEPAWFNFTASKATGAPGQEDGILVVAVEVTEQILARQREQEARALAERSVARYRILADTTSIVVWSTDPDGRVIDDSASWRRFTGQSYDEWKGVGWLDAVHPDDRDRASVAWSNAVRDKRTYEVEYRLRRADGGWAWTRARGAPVLGANGEIVEWVGSNVDLTAARSAESAARAEREQLVRVLEHAPASIGILRGPDHVMEFGNQIYRASLKGLEPWGMPVRRAFPTLNPVFFEMLDRVYRSNEPVVLREQYVRVEAGDGAMIEGWFDVVYQPLHDASGAVSGVLSFSTDVSDNVRARHAIAASERRYRSLIDATSQIVWTNSPEGEMRGEQPGWSRLTGMSREQYEGYGWAEAVHPDDRAETVTRWQEAVRTNGVFLCEHRVRRADGAWRWFSIRGVPVLDEQGKLNEWVGVHTDVSDARRAEVERDRLIEALSRSNAELDQFAYVASHDLKAPLRGIANLSQWVEEDAGESLPASAKEHMALLRGRVHRLEALIDGILDYSRAGRARDPFVEVDTEALAREVVELLAPPDGTKVTVEPSMPKVRAERVPLQQVLMNLVGNAIKHGRGGEIVIGARDLGTHHELFVRDRGPGIPAEYHDRIWGIFQTLEARDRVEGTGIGLAVVRKVIEARGGRATVESAPGEGTTFRVTLPKRPVERDASA